MKTFSRGTSDEWQYLFPPTTHSASNNDLEDSVNTVGLLRILGALVPSYCAKASGEAPVQVVLPSALQL